MTPPNQPMSRTVSKLCAGLLCLSLSFGCSNLALGPDYLDGDEAAFRLELAFAEINALNPGFGYITLVAVSGAGLAGVDLNNLLVVSATLMQISARNWARNLVITHKYYVTTEVDACAASIRATGQALNVYYRSGSVNFGTTWGILTTSFAPSIAAGTCNLRPVADLLFVRSGLETPSSEDDE